jgi:urea carboxylase
MAVPHSAAILDRRAGVEGKPDVTYRLAGDRYLLVEYGEMALDLTLNFFVLAVLESLDERPIEGIIETAPGLRSILVHYDSTRLPLGRLVERLDELHARVPAETALTLPSRLLHLPICFDDSQTREAVKRYIGSIRADAPNTEGGTNVDYIVRYSGLRDREELYRLIEGTEWWNAFTGFFPGLPFMFPLDPRKEVVVPKYNPTRTWTPEGAVGIGGPCVAIYPVESPGGYQLFGRTLPIYDIQERNRAFKGDPILIKPGDRVRFERVEEAELLRLFEEVRADRYQYRIEHAPFDVSAYLRTLESVAAEASAFRARRDAGAAATPVP